MRKLKLNIGGRPRTLDDYQVLMDLITKSTEAQYKDRGAFILEGCTVSGNNISAGIVFIDGELMIFPGASGRSWPDYISADTVVNDVNDLYDDGGTKATQTESAAKIGTSVPESGEYITISSTGGRTWYDAQADEFVRMKGSQTIQGVKTFAEKVYSAGVDLVAKIASLETNKVDKISGKGLSANDFTNTFKTKLNDLYSKASLDTKFNGKVDKITGKGLSANDFTSAFKTKLNDLYSKASLDTMFNNKANKSQAGWSTLTLKNGWGGTIKYRIDEWGICHFYGSLIPYNATNKLFSSAMPNPAGVVYFIMVYTYSFSASTAIADPLRINTNGDCEIKDDFANSIGVGYTINGSFPVA